ncbi:MAG: hypothetical protein ABI727_06420 [Nitrosospira sp.]
MTSCSCQLRPAPEPEHRLITTEVIMVLVATTRIQADIAIVVVNGLY